MFFADGNKSLPIKQEIHSDTDSMLELLCKIDDI